MLSSLSPLPIPKGITMNRTGWLAAFVLALAPLPCFGQMGGMGGMGAGMGGMGMGMGGMGGGGMAALNSPPKPLEEWTVKVETVGKQAVTGKLQLTAVAVRCELGIYEIKPAKVKAIEFAAAEGDTQPTFGMYGIERNGSVITTSGEKVTGIIAVPVSWRIETELGTLIPDAQQLKLFTFVARVPTDGVGPDGLKPNAGSKPGGSDKPKGGKPGEASEKTP
jgi:hypothetical protein